MTVHADRPAAAAKVAVGSLLGQEKGDSLRHLRSVFPLGVGIARAEERKQGQARQRCVRLPVGAFAKARFTGRAMDGEVVVSSRRASILITGGPTVPSAVIVLVPCQPIERALDGLLAGGGGALALRGLRTVGFEPRTIHARDLLHR